METHERRLAARRPARQLMPAACAGRCSRLSALLLAGALYLVAVRGEALLLDLSAFSQRVFCF